MNKCDYVVALVGQPNVGKSTLFNILTGEYTRVGNWPGTTIERKEGRKAYRGKNICFVDLPGIYGLSTSSLEEIIAREYIVKNKPDVVLVLADSTALERTLFLPIQILEFFPKVIVVLTKIDQAHPLGVHMNVEKLSQKLGVPVVAVSSMTREGIKTLLDEIVEVAETPLSQFSLLEIDYDGLSPYIEELTEKIRKAGILREYPARWVAIRLLEGDKELEEKITRAGKENLLHQVRIMRAEIKKLTGREPIDLAVAARFAFVDSLISEVVVRKHTKGREAFSRIDRVFMKPVIGPVFSIGVLLGVFFIAFTINTGFPLNILLGEIGLTKIATLLEEYSISGVLNTLFNNLGEAVKDIVSRSNGPAWLASLLGDGIIPGVGAVLSFLPLIMMIFFLLALIEDTGIAPRIAVSLNEFFARFGLTGRAVYPFLISLGCNVPGVLATRAEIDEKSRISAIFAAPFVPCQARFVVLAAITSIFFRSVLAQVFSLVTIYVVALIIALATALIVRKILLREKEKPEFLLEIPPIHKPSLRVVWWLTWSNSKHFLIKAGTVIFMLSVVTWALLYIGPSGYNVEPTESYGAIIGKFFAPLLKIYDITGDAAWILAFALLHGFVAKEAFLESLALLSGGEELSTMIHMLGLTTPQLMSILVFFTLYVPCLATIAVMYQELKSLRYTVLAILYMVFTAIIISAIVYLVLSLLI